MNAKEHGSAGKVASLHLHPRVAGERFQSVELIEVEAGKGIAGNGRYFARRSRSGGFSKRQVSLIEREQIAEHAVALGLQSIPPGMIRANIETHGVDLVSLIGKRIQIGTAILHLYEARTGCAKMDAICAGLRELTEGNRLGVLAQVVQSGRIGNGDFIVMAEQPVP